MTLNLAAIFGTEITAIIPKAASPETADLEVDDRAVAQVEAVIRPEFAPWPIVEGTEHCQVFVPDEECRWRELIPGHHTDFRQPSRLRALCSAKGGTVP